MVRKATLASVLAKAAVGIRFNEHMKFDDGEVVFYHASPARPNIVLEQPALMTVD